MRHDFGQLLPYTVLIQTFVMRPVCTRAIQAKITFSTRGRPLCTRMFQNQAPISSTLKFSDQVFLQIFLVLVNEQIYLPTVSANVVSYQNKTELFGSSMEFRFFRECRATMVDSFDSG